MAGKLENRSLPRDRLRRSRPVRGHLKQRSEEEALDTRDALDGRFRIHPAAGKGACQTTRLLSMKSGKRGHSFFRGSERGQGTQLA